MHQELVDPGIWSATEAAGNRHAERGARRSPRDQRVARRDRVTHPYEGHGPRRNRYTMDERAAATVVQWPHCRSRIDSTCRAIAVAVAVTIAARSRRHFLDASPTTL
jgi:hypothetical protein